MQRDESTTVCCYFIHNPPRWREADFVELIETNEPFPQGDARCLLVKALIGHGEDFQLGNPAVPHSLILEKYQPILAELGY